MSRSLTLMRHAKQTGLAVPDHERPLSEEGRRAAERVGAGLAARSILPQHALSSTALRCRETFESVSTGAGRVIPIDFEPKLYNASAAGLLEAIAEVDDAIESLLLLAHNPGISMLGIQLGGSRDEDLDMLRAGFTPATTARFVIDGEWSTVSPRTSRLIEFASPPTR